MKTLCLSFSKFTDMNFQKKSQFIYASLIGNVSFKTLGKLLPLVNDAVNKYVTDLAAAATNDRNSVAKKNQSRAELETLLKQLGLAVMAEAKGDEVMLVSSGYTLVKKPEPRYITNPGNVSLSQGVTSGQMISLVKAMTGARSYIHQITEVPPTDNSTWINNTSSSSRFVFQSLTPGKQYWVRIGVVGSKNQIAYSNVGSWFAQ